MKSAHQVRWGDSRLLHTDKAFQLVIFSPPYFNPSASRQRAGFGYCPEGSLSEYVDAVSNVVRHCLHYLVDTGIICCIKTDVWYRSTTIPVSAYLVGAYQEIGLELRQHIIWVRRSYFSPYSPRFSNILIFSQRGVRTPRLTNELIESRLSRKGGVDAIPVSVFAELISRLTNPGDWILNPFLGTGSFTVAALQTARNSLGVEILRSRWEVACRRLRPFGDIATLTFPRGHGGLSIPLRHARK